MLEVYVCTHSIYYSINVQGSLWMCYKLVI
jgi:hypothetical protein